MSHCAADLGNSDTQFTEARSRSGAWGLLSTTTPTRPRPPFKVSAFDGIDTERGRRPSTAAVPTATIKVLTANGFDLKTDETFGLTAMGDVGRVIQPTTTPTTLITIVNAAQHFKYVIDGVGLTLDDVSAPTAINGGTITAIHVLN